MAIKEEDAKNKLEEKHVHVGLRLCERLKNFPLTLWRERIVREKEKVLSSETRISIASCNIGIRIKEKTIEPIKMQFNDLPN